MPEQYVNVKKVHAQIMDDFETALEVIETGNVVEVPDGWISVKEKLPEDETRVLCFTKKGGYLISRYNIRFAHWMCADNIGITHWMPLPQPPKGE